MIPTTYLSIHDIAGLQAVALQSMDTPLVLRVHDDHGTTQISLYGLAAAKVERIADAINSIMLEPVPAPKVMPSEAAAYKSHDDYMACLIRDLGRDPIEVPK